MMRSIALLSRLGLCLVEIGDNEKLKEYEEERKAAIVIGK